MELGGGRSDRTAPHPSPHLSRDQEKRWRKSTSREKHPGAPQLAPPRDGPGGRQSERGHRERAVWQRRDRPPPPLPTPPRRNREREPPPRIRKVGADGEERTRVPYPCWGLRRGAARRPLLLLLPLLARPLRRQEAGPPLGSSPAELRRDKEEPPSARGAPRPVRSPRPARNRRRLRLLTRGGRRALPRPPSRRFSHPRSLLPRGGTCWFVLAVGYNAERQPSPGARPWQLRRRPPSSNATPKSEVETGTEAGKVPGAGPGGGKSRENPQAALPRPRAFGLTAGLGLLPGAVTSRPGLSRRPRPGAQSG